MMVTMSLGRPYPPGAEIPASANTLVGIAEIADRAGVPRPTASMWALRKETSEFPEAVARLRMGPVYDWSEVKVWLESRDIVYTEPPEEQS